MGGQIGPNIFAEFHSLAIPWALILNARLKLFDVCVSKP